MFHYFINYINYINIYIYKTMNIMLGNIVYKFYNFDLNLLNNKANKICIIGMTNTGKTTLVLNILNKLKNIDYGSIITPTDRIEQTYKKHFLMNSHIDYEYKSEILDKLLLRQNTLEKPNFLFIMDNCDCVKYKWTLDDNFQKLMMNDYNITFILTMQYSIGMYHRHYFDYIFITEADLTLIRKKLYDHYFSEVFNTFETFNIIYNKIMKDYRCIVLDTKNKVMYIYDICKNNEIIGDIKMVNITDFNKIINIEI